MEPIIEIIPKITSPLAVICFVFYIFYLFKKSQDEKKEKSLTVSDKKAQGDAARLILKDHPDVEIDRITDPAAAIELARQIVGDNLKKHNKTLNTLLLFALIFAVTFIISLWLSKSSGTEPKPGTKTNESWAKVESLKKQYPYASLSVVQHIKLMLNKKTDSTEEMITEFRNHYILSANRDISSAETIFEEQYSTSMGEIEYWQGSHKQKIKSNDPKNYWVHFDLKKNDVKSILTGANYRYLLPLKKSGSPSCFSSLVVNPENEYFTCYPNSLDYIDDLTIIVESNDFILELPPNSALRKVKPEADEIVSEGSCKVYMKNDQCTLAANWSRITPGECVGFKFRWTRRK